MEELKPCPFCGGEAELREERHAGRTRFYVSCENDDCRVIVETRNSVSATMAGAIEAWNRRAENEELLFTRQFILDKGLLNELLKAWNRRADNG